MNRTTSVLLIIALFYLSCKQDKTILDARIAKEVLRINDTLPTPKPSYKGMETSSHSFLWRAKKGYDFNRFSEHNKESDNTGKVATYHIKQLKNGQVFFSTFEKNSPLEMLINAASNSNPIQDALKIMHPNDSIYMSLDAAFWEKKPKQFQASDRMEICLKLLHVEDESLRIAIRASNDKKAQLLPNRMRQLLPLDRMGVSDLGNDLKRLTIVEGQGNQILPQSKVRMNYIGMLEDGFVFRNTFKEKIPREFKQGSSNLIEGWNEICLGMREGGKYLFFVPASLAYGATGNEAKQIPGDSDLVFYAEVLKVNND